MKRHLSCISLFTRRSWRRITAWMDWPRNFEGDGLLGITLLSDPTPIHCQFDSCELIFVKFVFKYECFLWEYIGEIPLTIIGSDNGLVPPSRCTNDGILFIGLLGTNFSEILIGIKKYLFKKFHMKMSSANWRPFCLHPHVLNLSFNPVDVLEMMRWTKLDGTFDPLNRAIKLYSVAVSSF